MLVEGQLIKTKWIACTKEWYESKGYVFTKCNDELTVRAEDLPSTSKYRVNVCCDGDDCNCSVNIPYMDYVASLTKYGKYLCHQCANRLAAKRRLQKKQEKYRETFVKWCKKNNYIPLTPDDEIITAKSKLYFECPTHGIGYTIYDRINQGQIAGKCCQGKLERKAQALNIETVKNIIESKNGNNLLNPQDYINAHTKNLRIICGSCGDEFMSSLSSIKNSNGRCFKCGRDFMTWKSHDNLLLNRYKKYVDKCKILGYTPLMQMKDFDIPNFSNTGIIKFVCPIHGEVEQYYCNFVIGDAICKYCGIDNRNERKRFNQETVIGIIESKNNNKLLNPEDYQNNNKYNLKVQCGCCGSVFFTALANYRTNIDGKCPHCHERSRGERIIAMLLDKYHVTYSRQEHFNRDLHDIKPIPLDFYLPEFNLAIEFDGQGHYYPVWGEESFYRTLLHDGMKNNYCRWNHIDLLRIPYWEGDHIEEIFTDRLNLTPIESKHIKYIPAKIHSKKSA